MTFSNCPAFALLALSAFLAGCASNPHKMDPYAEAATTKRIEIDRLSRRIDSLRVLPATDAIDRQLDSLRGLRSFEAGNLQGIGQAAQIQGSMTDTTEKIRLFDQAAKHVIEKNQKYPIK